MTVRFVPLFSLTVTHGFSGGRYRDIAYVLPQDTARLLENGRLLAKPMDGQLVVLFQADDGGQPLVPVAGGTLRIGLRPTSLHFGNVTALSVDPARFVAAYGNAANPLALAGPAPATLVGPLFGHALQDAARPVTVTVTDATGAVMRTTDVTAANALTTVSLDLRGEAPGRLTLTEEYPGPQTRTTAYYLDAELGQEGVLAIVEVRIDAGFYATAADLTVAFTAQQDTLKYYVVARNYSDGDVAQLNVSDAGFAEEARPQVTFTKVAANAFTAAEIPAAVLAGADAKVVLFKSQAPVPRREGGRRKIQLQKNGEILVKHLPHPAPDSASADRIVHVSKP